MPNFEVRLGMGLHLGESIEGAIGSYYKIDASYISNHQKMSERLEGATKAFGCPLLISEALHHHLSRKTKEYCRCVDWVIFPGTTDPVHLYTIDVDPEVIQVVQDIDYMSSEERRIKRVKERMQRDDMRDRAFMGEFDVPEIF